jgi:hypothetical protein
MKFYHARLKNKKWIPFEDGPTIQVDVNGHFEVTDDIVIKTLERVLINNPEYVDAEGNKLIFAEGTDGFKEAVIPVEELKDSPMEITKRDIKIEELEAEIVALKAGDSSAKEIEELTKALKDQANSSAKEIEGLRKTLEAQVTAGEKMSEENLKLKEDIKTLKAGQKK